MHALKKQSLYVPTAELVEDRHGRRDKSCSALHRIKTRFIWIYSPSQPLPLHFRWTKDFEIYYLAPKRIFQKIVLFCES